jgi:tetratricopeptide (TPR) repeat protein
MKERSLVSPVRRKSSDLKFVIMIIISTLLVLTGMYFLNDIILTIRLVELQASLRESNRAAARTDYLAMAAQFKLYLELYRGAIDEKRLDEEELNIIYLSTSAELGSKIAVMKYKEASKPIIAVMNLIRYMLGKPSIEAMIDNRTDSGLAVAYYFERNKKFRKALSVYDEAFSDGNVPGDKMPVIQLHRGFCYGVAGEYGTAKSIFIDIIKKYHGKNESTAAALMLQYLEDFLDELNKVRSSSETASQKAEKFFNLMAYNDALSILEKDGGGNEKERERKKYLEARCREETGDEEEAAKIYQEIIQNNHDTETAKDANRRLLVMSSADDKGDNLKTLAEKNNELIKDSEFVKMVDTSNKIKSNRQKLPPEAKKNIEHIMDLDAHENPGDRDSFDKFVSDAIKTTEETITREKIAASITPEPIKPAVVTATPAPRNTRPPEVKRTSQPTPESTIVPVHGKQSGQPFTKSYRDEKGNIVKVESYDANGNLEMTIYYEYDDSGNPAKIRVYDKNGRPMVD